VSLPAVAVSGLPILVIFAPGILTALVLLTLLIQVASKGALPKGPVPVIMAVIIVALLGFNMYFINGILNGKKTFSDLGVKISEKIPPTAESELGRALFISSEPELVISKEADKKIVLRQDDINNALQRHLVYEGQGSEGTFDFARGKTILMIDPHRLSILEEVKFFHRKFLMQTHLLVKLSEDKIDFYDFEVVLGNTKLPGLMAAHLWKQIQPQYQGVIKQLGLGKHYGIHTIEPGQIIMLMTSQPEGTVDVQDEIKRIIQETKRNG
jgi:hypothetical protein